MSRLKELSEKAKSQKNKEGENIEDDKSYEFLYDTLFENSLSYLFGSIETYFYLNGETPPEPEKVSDHLKSIPKNLDTEDKRKKYFKESNNAIDKFLFWFFYERKPQ